METFAHPLVYGSKLMPSGPLLLGVVMLLGTWTVLQRQPASPPYQVYSGDCCQDHRPSRSKAVREKALAEAVSDDLTQLETEYYA